jgi:uncharacterized protein YuzE
MWRAYDPRWLVEAAKKAFPNDTALHDALARCTQATGEEPVIYFTDPNNDWHIARDVRLNDTPKGDVEVDILKDGRIGGIEILMGEWRAGTFG